MWTPKSPLDEISVRLTREEWGAVVCGLISLREDAEWDAPNLIRSTERKILACFANANDNTKSL